jgi:hypothetical protein
MCITGRGLCPVPACYVQIKKDIDKSRDMWL